MKECIYESQEKPLYLFNYSHSIYFRGYLEILFKGQKMPDLPQMSEWNLIPITQKKFQKNKPNLDTVQKYQKLIL